MIIPFTLVVSLGSKSSPHFRDAQLVQMECAAMLLVHLSLSGGTHTQDFNAHTSTTDDTGIDSRQCLDAMGFLPGDPAILPDAYPCRVNP